MKDEENEKEMETKEKQSMSMKKKWVTLVSMAVVFGLIAGGVMYGVNAAGNRLYAQSHIANTDTLSDADEVSSDSTDNGSASVEEVTKDAMPSLVTISTMSVEEMRNFFGGTQKYEVEGAGTELSWERMIQNCLSPQITMCGRSQQSFCRLYR